MTTYASYFQNTTAGSEDLHLRGYLARPVGL